MVKVRLKAGDVIGFSGVAFESDIINLFTYGIPRRDLSHIAIIAPGPTGKLLLWEANENAVSPCEITGKLTKGVQAHDPATRIDGYDGRAFYYELSRSLYPHETLRLKQRLLSDLEKAYDKDGAIRAGGIIFSAIESVLFKPDYSSFFCSELVVNKLSEIGVFSTSHASKYSPNYLVRELRRHGIVNRKVRLK
jgi:hypothetical protein